MIKFFRHIRQRMIKENPSHAKASVNKRVSKYLLYAIGEIVLVVIGILIALQINNWNEERKVELSVQGQMRSMTKELREDAKFFQSLIERNQRQIVFLRSITSNNYDILDLANSAGRISLNYEPRKFGVAYHKLKERGELKLVEDEELKESMTTYFEETTVNYNGASSWHKEFVMRNVEPYILKKLPLDTSALTDPAAVVRAMSDTEFMNIVNMQLRNFKQIEYYTNQALTEAQDLIELINEDLKESP